MSSGSESDEDFVPGEPEQLSEEDSADEETDLQYEKEVEHKVTKRKAAEVPTGKKKRKTKKVKIPPVEQKEEVPDKAFDAEEEKKKEEDLWAKFLEGTDTKLKAAPKESDKKPEKPQTIANQVKPQSEPDNKKTNDDSARERRIFEFAGETIVVENNTIKEKIKDPNTVTVNKLVGSTSRGRGGGLSSVLGQLNRKTKLSTLEKSKLDWETYKKEEGVEEEIQSHNKGKDGYLDRQDFLERADVRQYEIERDLRLSRRSNR